MIEITEDEKYVHYLGYRFGIVANTVENLRLLEQTSVDIGIEWCRYSPSDDKPIYVCFKSKEDAQLVSMQSMLVKLSV